MPFIDPSKISSSEKYDAIVIGSGAAGGMSAHVLAQAGVRVLLIEAGKNNTSVKSNDYDPEKPKPLFDVARDGWAIEKEPYRVENLTENKFDIAKDVIYKNVEVEQNYTWFRSRLLGGRTNYWGQTSLRFGPYDFKPYDYDGQSDNWPISYEELAPYYDKVDQLIGITGTKEGLENNPDSDFFLSPPKFRAIDHIFKKAGEKLGRPVVSKRTAILTQPLSHRKDRKPFYMAKDYHHSCELGSSFQSTNGFIEPAFETGNLDLLCDCMARSISVDENGKANGVHFIDKNSGKDYFVSSDAVVLGAGSMESVRLLLNSKSSLFPNGIGNSHGNLGRWIMDTTQVDHGKVRIPSLAGIKPYNEDGLSVSHAYAPCTNWNELRSGKLGFTRGFYLTWKGGRRRPGFKTISKLFSLGHSENIFFGEKWKKSVRENFGSLFSFYTPGEAIPSYNNFCEIDPELKDAWGIPALRFHYKWGEQEQQQMKHKIKYVAELVDEAGGEFVDGIKDPKLNTPGSNHHESGGARMSFKAEKGVTNSLSQVWDCPNVVIADSSVFASTSCKNPTLTIMALAWRASENLIRSMKKIGTN